MGLIRRELPLTRRWLLSSINDHYTGGAEYEADPQRLGFTGAPEELHRLCLDEHPRWQGVLFVYSEMTNELVDVASAFAPPSLAACARVLAADPPRDNAFVAEVVEALIAIGQWAHTRMEDITNQAATALAPFADERTAREVRKALLLAGATNFGRRVGFEPQAAAQRLIDEFSDLLAGHELMQVTTIAIGSDPDVLLASADQLVAAAQVYADHVAQNAPTSTSKRYAASRMFRFVGPPLYSLVRSGHLAEAQRLLRVWLGRDALDDLPGGFAQRTRSDHLAAARVRGSTSRVARRRSIT